MKIYLADRVIDDLNTIVGAKLFDWEHDRMQEFEADMEDENPPAEDNDPIQD